MMTKRFFATMTIMMVMGTAAMFANNNMSDRKDKEDRMEMRMDVRETRHTHHCEMEMRDARHRHDAHCTCACHHKDKKHDNVRAKGYNEVHVADKARTRR